METVRMTTTQAIVEWLVNRYTVVDGDEAPLFAGRSVSSGTGMSHAWPRRSNRRRTASPPGAGTTSNRWPRPPG